MKKRLLSGVMTITIIAALLTGCGSSAQQAAVSGDSTATGTEPAASQNGGAGDDRTVIRIGAICWLTGGSAIYGEGAQNAVTMAAVEINSSDSP